MEIELQRNKVVRGDVSHDSYTVHVSGHRILTVATDCNNTVDKWTRAVHKLRSNTKHNRLLIGAVLEHHRCDGGYINDSILLLCTGSHCLLYHLPYPKDYVPPPSLFKFLADADVTVVAKNMGEVKKKLEEDYEVTVANGVDLNELAAEVLMEKAEKLDLLRYDFDRLMEVVLGRHMYVNRPAKAVRWYESWFHWWRDPMRDEKVKLVTADAYLCFLMAKNLVDRMYEKKKGKAGSGGDVAAKKEKEKKKKKKKMMKQKNTKKNMMMMLMEKEVQQFVN